MTSYQKRLVGSNYRATLQIPFVRLVRSTLAGLMGQVKYHNVVSGLHLT